MLTKFVMHRVYLLALAFGLSLNLYGAEDFDKFPKPLFAKNCTQCHGEKKKVKGKVNLLEIKTAEQLLAKPKLIKELIESIDARDMPPEDEPELDEKDRLKLLATLKAMLRESTDAGHWEVTQVRMRRLNRFHYNNSIRDLFRLNRDVFVLPEKLMTRGSNYLQDKTGKMPDRVNVSCLSLNPTGGLREVNSYPKDLRAAHGFDNQANQLTLSPLLLDAFLKLAVSILESPDFNQGTVGIWNDFFKEPAADADLQTEIKKRLAPFLRQTFRGPVEEETLNRYVNYATSKTKQGLSFTDSMKKVASAALSSPLFLFRYTTENEKKAEFALASNLSFFLWGSCPDAELLDLAESGELSKPDNLTKTMERMLADPKVERFLDTFPGQWMQLENVLAATPDPKKFRFFTIDKSYPASLQMVLEPLLLFDAVFIEDRPVIELIAPTFGYQSDFLKTWYTSDLEPPKSDPAEIIEKNRANEEKRKALEATIQSTEKELQALLEPVRAKILSARKQAAGEKEPVNLKPYATWEFDGDLKSSVGDFPVTPTGKISFKDGMVVLNKAYLISKALPVDLRAKSLEVWFKPHDVNQQGGGVMGIQGPGDFFDTIVLGERKQRHWISGSNGHSRTLDFPGSTPEQKSGEVLHLVMVYKEDGTTTLYRNGKPYGKPYRKGKASFPRNKTSVIFGLRHLPAGGNKYLSVSIDKARLYNRALVAGEVQASHSGQNLYVSDKDVTEALDADQKKNKNTLVKTIKESENAIKKIPKPLDARKYKQEVQKRFDNQIRSKVRSRDFERIATTDPRYGGIITNAALMSMTSGPKRTHPIARGAWIIEVILNDPPPPPPNDVPLLGEDVNERKLTIKEQFVEHRDNPDCAGCHAKIDPLGFALENFDVTGRWRDKYANGNAVDPSGKLLRKHNFETVVHFKESLVKENRRFAKAFTKHLLRFALSRELGPVDTLTVDDVVDKTEKENFKMKSLIREVVLSERFLQAN